MQLAYFMPLIQLEPTNLIMMQFMQSLLTAGARKHYRVLVVAQDGDPRDDIRSLAAGRIVDGFVLSELQPDDRRAELLSELGMPFACFGRTRPGLPQPWADIDNVEAEAEAVRHVIERGYTRPGLYRLCGGNLLGRGPRGRIPGWAWPAAAFPATARE